jgi:NitT/TauT family transport system substrate-binding protein
VADAKGQLNAFLLKDAATAYAQANKGRVVDFAAARDEAATRVAAN